MAAVRGACFLSRNRTITKLLQNPNPHRHAPPPPLPSFHHQTSSSSFSTFANHKFFQNPNIFSLSSLIHPTSTILNPNPTTITTRSFSAKVPSSGASDKKSGPKHPSKKKNNKSSSKKASAVNLRRTKIRFLKQRRGSITGVTHQGNTVAFGKYGLQALEAARITSRQIEAGRKSMTRYAHRGRGGKIWIRMIADKSVTAKPVEVRMGRGKGAIKGMVSVVKPGKILYEISGIPENLAKEAITLAGSKLPIKSKFVTAS